MHASTHERTRKHARTQTHTFYLKESITLNVSGEKLVLSITGSYLSANAEDSFMGASLLFQSELKTVKQTK